MAKIEWDKTGEHLYENGIRNGVLYRRNADGTYGGANNPGVAWNGLTTVTESPEGAEPTDLYADDIKYLTMRSAETFGATVECYTYPDEFMECNGEASLVTGVYIAQQPRVSFGLCYRTVVGNDVQLENYGYKLHLVYGCTASPSEKGYQTINDSPEAITFSFEIKTVPENVTIQGRSDKPTSLIIIDTSKLTTPTQRANLTTLEGILYGSDNADPRLPLPAEVYSIMSAT